MSSASVAMKEKAMTNKEKFMETMDAIIDYCESAKAIDCTEEDYRRLESAAIHARSIMYSIVEARQEVLEEYGNG
jgi:Asp-tRNA(Asn)/Glu-tRNA(Gln) amidotransferase C subunit